MLTDDELREQPSVGEAVQEVSPPLVLPNRFIPLRERIARRQEQMEKNKSFDASIE